MLFVTSPELPTCQGATKYCKAHGGGRRCNEEGCSRASAGPTGKCGTHGGGRRCNEPGCGRPASAGPVAKCGSHGGGKRCSEEGCERPAQGPTGRCGQHGGGRKCAFVFADPSSSSSGSGGSSSGSGDSAGSVEGGGGGDGRAEDGSGIRTCSKTAQHGTPFCVAHGGGKICTVDACAKAARGSSGLCKVIVFGVVVLSLTTEFVIFQ